MTGALQEIMRYFLPATFYVTVQMRVTVFQRLIIVLLILVRIMALVLMMVLTSLVSVHLDILMKNVAQILITV